MYSLKQEIDILESKTNRYKKILEKFPNAILSQLDHLGTNDIILSNRLTKVDNIEIFANLRYDNNRIFLHAKQFIEDIPVYSIGIDFASFHYENHYSTTYTTIVPQFPNVIPIRVCNIVFSNYIQELEALRVKESTIKKIEMYIYNKYLKEPLKCMDQKENQYIPSTFKKLLIFNND